MYTILHCLLWIALASTSGYNCRHHGGFYEYPHYEDDDPSPSPKVDEEHFRPEYYNRRIDYENFDRHSMNARSAERSFQRMNERSIAVDSGIQRVQDQERRRTRPEAASRIDNGSYKVVNYASAASRRGPSAQTSSSDSVVFPGPTSQTKRLVPQIPEECRALGYCEDVPNYPTEIANKILSELQKSNLTGTLVLETLDPKIEQRIGSSEETIELCSFQERLVMPRAAPDKKGEWHFIVNTDSPVQGYRVEVCDAGKPTCGEGVAYFHSGYKARCQQKYVKRTLVAIGADGEPTYDLQFQVPSCCSCVVAHYG